MIIEKSRLIKDEGELTKLIGFPFCSARPLLKREGIYVVFVSKQQ
ncbi:MAG: hypothetical protein RIM23_14235 [Coleofasciculus sp. G3-WIS-01]